MIDAADGARLLQELIIGGRTGDGKLFTDPRHEIIFTAMVELSHIGMHVDVISLAKQLHESKQLNAAGGSKHLAHLIDRDDFEAPHSHLSLVPVDE